MTQAWTRRGFLGAGGALAAMPLFQVSPSFAQAVKVSIGVGLANEQAAIVMQMQQQKLLEQAAQELGLAGMEAEYLNFPVLLRMLQGIAAGQLQFGQRGSTPCIRTLTSGDPAVPIALVGGFNTFPLQVPPGSPIKRLEDLRGKTVLTIVGSTCISCWSGCLRPISELPTRRSSASPCATSMRWLSSAGRLRAWMRW